MEKKDVKIVLSISMKQSKTEGTGMLKIIVSLIAIISFISCSTAKKSVQPETDWAQGIVWYQIFPERFYNALPQNDPLAGEVPDAENMPGWRVNPWNNDWYEMQSWELKKSDKFYDVIFTRRYGGDLIGVIEKLDYLKDLGVDAIYFNPVFEAPSLHKYDGASYHHIDDNFGPNPHKDRSRLKQAKETADPSTWIWTSADSTFLKLIKEIHKRDMKIVIDGVFNHMGDWSFAFIDVKENQQESIYKDWFDIKRWDDPETPENEFEYKGWWGVQTLPELAEDSLGIVSGPRAYIFAATKRWMDPNDDGDPSDGIDGWRLDVAEEVAMPFWVDWNALVKSINPKAITVAEIWHDASDWIKSKAFDGTMNYQFSMAVQAFFIHQEKTISANELGKRLKEIEQKYGAYTSGLLWNLMDSHDTDRLVSMIANPDRDYDRQAGPRDNADYKVCKPNQQQWQILKQIAAFQLTFTGAPMIYYGTEAGMWGGDDPDDRKPMLWPEIQFANESRHPLKGKKRMDDLNIFNRELYNYFKKMIHIRHQYSMLATGDFELLEQVSTESVFAFSRTDKNGKAVVLFNKAEQEQTVDVELGSAYTDVWTGAQVKPANTPVNIKIPARGFRILLTK